MAKLTAVKTIGTVKQAQDNIKQGGEYLQRAYTIGGQLLSLAKTLDDQLAIQYALTDTYIQFVSKYDPEMLARLKANKYATAEERQKDTDKKKQHEANALRQINKYTCRAFAWKRLKSESASAKKAAKTRGANKKIKIDKLTKKQQAELASKATSKPIPAPMDSMIFRTGYIRHDFLELRVKDINACLTISKQFDQSKLTEDDNYILSIMEAVKTSL